MKTIFYLFITFAFSSCYFAPGSYPYAEVYEMDVSEEVLINAVKKFKRENPEYIVPKNLCLIDGKDTNNTDLWYHIWFYYPKRNEIVYTWIRGNNIYSEFALISINKGMNLGYWKRINKDFKRQDNNQHKKQFERLILYEIKKIIESKQ